MPVNRVPRRAALTVSILAALIAGSCAGPVPPVPTPAVEGFDPEVRDAISTAYGQAVTQPSSGQASGRLGMVLQAHAVYQPALLAYDRAIRLEPKEFAWRYYRALVVRQLSGPEKALAAFSEALRIRAGYAPALLQKGDLLFQLGRLKESGDIYKSLLSEDPASAEALYGLARVRYAQKDLSAADDLYGRACRAYQTFGAAYFGLATAERALGRSAESASNFKLAERYSADRPPVEDPLRDRMAALATGIYYRLAQGDQLARRGRPDEAARLNEAMLARDPDNFGVLLNLLYLARFVDRLNDRVESFYDKARQINPQVPLTYDYYGGALAREGKYDAASVALRKAIELRPDYGEAHALLAEVLERQNRPLEAIDQYQLALNAEPSDRAVHMNLWRLLIISGRSREVIPQLIASLSLEDTYSALRLVLLGEAYRTTGELVKSRQYLEQARNRVLHEGPPALLAQIDQELAQTPQP
jgi:tetratricopeptide (TPR) repeat protein